MTLYKFTNLTNAVKERDSPLRQYLNQRFPNARQLQTEYRTRCGNLIVDSGGANAGTLGAAFDFQVRFVLDPSVRPTVAILAFGGRPEYSTAIEGIMHRAAGSAREVDDEVLARACWALALCAEVYRVGGITPGSPLGPLLVAGNFTTEALLALAPDDAVRQLRELEAIAAESLLPHLEKPLTLGPTFDASRLCSADADLIAGGCSWTSRLIWEQRTRGPVFAPTGCHLSGSSESRV